MAPSVSQSLVLYRPSSPSTLATRSTATSLVSSRLFTATTGTAIATELLYRLLWDIVNRLLHSFQAFASERLDRFSSYLEQRANERRLAAQNKKNNDGNELKIVEQVSKLVEEKGFGGSFDCPMSGGQRKGPTPPRWVQGVLQGVEEGRMQERDFWIHTHTG